MIGAIRLTEETLRRTYRASFIVFLAALLVSLGYRSAFVSLGLLAGWALAILVLLSWQFIVKNAFGPQAPGPRGNSPEAAAPAGENSPESAPQAANPGNRKALAVGLGLAKLPILGAVVYALIGRGLVSAEAFAIGFVIPQLTIALLAVGRKEDLGRVAAPRRG